MTNAYRPEIDGLRAISVLAVICYHAGIPAFTGGYVGVDVFFVISGYLITSILLAQLAQGQFSYSVFIERRARRILPMLLATMLLALPLAWLLLSPSQLTTFASSALATLGFLTNIFFYADAGYFDQATELAPLVHAWSLAVEEQYYLIFPFLLLGLYRLAKARLLWAIGALAVLSFVASSWASVQMQSANFYLLPFRAWELLAGSLLAIAQARGLVLLKSNVLASLGLLGVLVPMFLYTPATPFPGPYALLPVGGAVLVLAYAQPGAVVQQLLSHRLLVGVGLVSYSAYLLHQPLFAFARVRLEPNVVHMLLPALGLLSLVLAYLTWRFIEQPCRQASRVGKSQLMVLLAVLAAPTLVFAMAVKANNGYPSRFASEVQAILAYEEYDYRQPYLLDTCLLNEHQTYEAFAASCATSKQRLVWGDSHGSALANGYRLDGEGIGQLTASGCPPVVGVDISFRTHCRRINDHVMGWIKDNKPAEVILHANWALYDVDYMATLPATVQLLNQAGVPKVTLVGGVPQYEPSLPQVLVNEQAMLVKSHMSPMKKPIVTQKNQHLREVAVQVNIPFIDPLDVFCTQALCKTIVQTPNGYEPVAWDYGHLTAGGASYLVNAITQQYKGKTNR